MKKIGLLIVVVVGAMLLYFTGDFPKWGDPGSPANTYLSPHYILNAEKDTHAPNIVSALLADYRGYDTMFETAVVFAAGLACFFILSNREEKPADYYLYRHNSTGVTLRIEQGGKLPSQDSDHFTPIDSHWIPPDTIIKYSCRILIPFIQLYALYVLVHGHYSPGGGFQGGVILGATIILYAISHDLRGALKRMSEKAAGVLAAIGVLIYAGTGAVCLALGSEFLNYHQLAPILKSSLVMARSHSILIVEVGVAMAVMAVMVWIYINLSSAGSRDEGL